jgi:hypothetical protein
MKPALLIAFGSLVLVPAAHASERCVGAGHGCAKTLQAALDGARPGDTVRLGRGTFSGPVTIDRNVKLIGAGAGATVIRGGGPVVRIVTRGAPPDVLLQGLTVTGGTTTTSDHCSALCGEQYQSATALGGGISIPPGPGSSIGATVLVRDAAITANRAAPAATVSSIRAACPDGPCRFAIAAGGGIDNWGTLTLSRTRVSDNQAGGPLNSDAEAGGVYSAAGSLTVDHSVIDGNRVTSVPPYGRYAEGGGIFVDAGALTIRDSVVDGNAASLTSTLPAFAGDTLIDMNAHGGGIHVGDGVPTTIARTAITRNSVSASDPVGAPLSFDSAMLIGHSPATISDTLIDGNRGSGLSFNTEDTGPGGSALELDGGGTIARTTITRNTSVQRSAHGDAGVNGALAILNFDGNPKLVTMTDSLVAGNTAVAQTTTGDAIAQGGGVFNDSLLALRRVVVRDNSLRADGESGRAEGGGVWNSDELSGPPVELTLDRVLISHNMLAGPVTRGGGLFTAFPVTQTATTIARNAPDQCSGC